MPIYEYQCTKCGRKLEVMQRITDEPLKQCPTCKGQLRRLISRTSFQLKGTGWYATDYKNKDKRKKEAKADKGEDKTPKKSEETNAA